MKELRDYRAINVRRCITVWRKLEDWGADQWALRMVAEAAELCNAVTQYMEGRKRLEDVMSEYADVYAYLDLLAARLYVSPEGAWGHVLSKFNEVSERKGFAERIAFPPVDAPSYTNEPLMAMQQHDKDVALRVLDWISAGDDDGTDSCAPRAFNWGELRRRIESGEWKP
jgi:NTP pyrophosphatase (non-canonical NTP hydrolase)